MHFAKTDLVLPLGCAENAFLEVLLSRFTLKRRTKSGGVELRVVFDDKTLATWNRLGRETVRKRMPRFAKQADLYKTKLDEILLGGECCKFAHDDPDFFFRWASAGALPVLNIGQKEYYCLFFRDVFPIGWNIANGATDTSDELLNPLQALEREVGEELVDREREKRYVLQADKETLLDRPEFAVFRKRWREQYPDLDIARFRAAKLPLRWEKAPDRVTVQMGERVHNLQDCFVNINAADFGIEVDRIARITVNERLVLCDGEVTAHRALNRPVGLFEVSRLQNEIRAGRTSFTPDRFYHGGTARPGDDIGRFLNEVLLPEIKTWRSRRDIGRFEGTKDEDRLRLCPVTDSIIRRHIQSARPVSAPPTTYYDVFLSFASPDQPLAKRVFDGLRKQGLRVFFAPDSQAPGTWNRTIYAALSSANVFVGVATQLDHFARSWPQYEIDAFHMVHLDDPQARIIPFVRNIDPASLPLPLRNYTAIDCTRRTFDQALKKLLKLMPRTATSTGSTGKKKP